MTSIDEDWIEVTYPDYESPLKESVRKSLDPGLPRENPTQSSWQIPPDLLQNYRSSETLPTGILDVVIIGSGFSGTSVAWHLLHGDDIPRQTRLSTLMLEARDVCSGATGRNGIVSGDLELIVGGHLSCNFYSYFSTVEKQYDANEAALHSYFEKLNFDAVRQLIYREHIDCEFKWEDGGWDVFLTDEEFEWAKRELEGMKSAGGYVSSLKIFEGEAAAKVSRRLQCRTHERLQE
jgi:glycine/D-amino acid oxidase-like deaminating enzyme